MILRSVTETETEKNISDYWADFNKHRSNYILVIAIFNCRVFYLGCCSECSFEKFLLFRLNLALIFIINIHLKPGKKEAERKL